MVLPNVPEAVPRLGKFQRQQNAIINDNLTVPGRQNGFKCHVMSEAHQRQMLLVATTPGKFIDEFSIQFRDEFLRLLQRRYNTR